MTFASFPDRPFKLGFLSPHNPYDRRAFSSTPFFALRALQARPHLETHVLGHRPPRFTDRLLRRTAPKVALEKLDLAGLDGVVGLVASPLLDQLADLHPDLPFLHVTDATPAFLRECYGWNVPLAADDLETRVAAQAAHTVYSSKEIADRASVDLNLPGFSAKVAPFGVNIEHLPETCPTTRLRGPLKLLFIGLDWTRKGGDIAVAALDQLLAAGHAAELTIVGRCPERHRNHPAITYAGFLNKNRPADAQKLNRLLRNAHLLLVPSRGDCTPMVIAEAMAHGTPALAAETGGVASLIGDNGAGRIMPQYASPEEWSKAIAELVSDPDGYALMSDAGFDRSRSVLSWSSWAKSIERFARMAASPAIEQRRDSAA